MQVTVRRSFRASAWLLLALTCKVEPVAARPALRLVAQTGQFLPGSTTETYTDFDAPVLNDLGQAAVRVNFQTTSAGPFGDIFLTESSAGLRIAAHEFTAAPGFDPRFSVFRDFQPTPHLSNSGRVAFPASIGQTLTGPVFVRGIWSESAGGLGLVAVDGAAVGQLRYGDLDIATFKVNEGGQVALTATLQGNGVNASNDAGVWLGNAHPLQLVARKGAQPPGVTTGTRFTGFADTSLNDSGVLAFTATVSGADVTPANDHGIWSYANGTLGLALREGAAAPGLSGAVFGGQQSPTPTLSETFSSLVINNQGHMAFRANARQAGGSIPIPAGMGIWTNSSGSLALVAKDGDQAAGAPAGVSFLSLGNPLMSNSGQVVFASSVAGSGVDTTNDIGVWIQRGSQLDLVAREGAQAPGLPDGVVFTGFSNVSMNDAGQVAFQATLRNSSVPFNHQGIWATDLSGVLRLIVQTADTYELSPGNPLRMAGLTFLGGSSGSDGRPSAFNASGEIAFAAVFSGGVEALFVAAAVPEPASPLLIALAAVTLGPARMRRFRRSSPC